MFDSRSYDVKRSRLYILLDDIVMTSRKLAFRL